MRLTEQYRHQCNDICQAMADARSLSNVNPAGILESLVHGLRLHRIAMC